MWATATCKTYAAVAQLTEKLKAIMADAEAEAGVCSCRRCVGMPRRDAGRAVHACTARQTVERNTQSREELEDIVAGDLVRQTSHLDNRVGARRSTHDGGARAIGMHGCGHGERTVSVGAHAPLRMGALRGAWGGEGDGEAGGAR